MSTQLKLQKRNTPRFLCEPDSLVMPSQKFGKSSNEKVVLGGALLMASLDSLNPGPDFVGQAPRIGYRKQLLQKVKNPLVHVAVERQTLNRLLSLRQKPILAIDVLLRYGTKVKGADDLVVLSAFAGGDNTYLQALRFKKAVLVSLTEYVLVAPRAHTFETDLHVLLERLRMSHPQAAMHWCGPLALPSSESMVQVPSSIWQAAPAQAVTLTGKPGFLARHGLAVGLLVTSVVGAGSAVYLPYLEYFKARDELKHESSQLQGQYTFASERLVTLRAQQAFFDKAAKGDARLIQLERVLQVLAQEDGVRVRDAKLHSNIADLNGLGQSPLNAGGSSDFEVVIEVIREGGTTSLAQSKPLLQRLSEKMGMSLRLSTNDAYQDIEKSTSFDGKPRRAYRIQGDFSNAS